MDLGKAEEPDQIASICWIIKKKKQESSTKTSTSIYWLHQHLTV